MAEEFQAGICSGNWWNIARNEASPCTTAISDIGSFGWSNEMAEGDMKCVTRSSDESVSSNSLMMSFGLSLPTLDWNQSIFGRNNGTTEQNFNTMLEQDLQQRSSFHQVSGMESVPIQKEWSPKNYSDGSEDSFSQINQVALALDGHQNGLNSSKMSFPIVSSPALLPNLFESDPQPQPQQHPYETTPMSYQMINSNELSPWEKFPQFIKSASPKQQPNYSNLHFTNNTPFWGAGVMNRVGSTISLSPQAQFPASSFGDNPKCTSLAMKINHQLNTEEEVRESGMKRNSTLEPTFKRPRIETPSPLPTFKVRKEKLGDRITALQQLVSPFGKTDTASVLYEAIEYIKFLHDQVHVLSTPFMKNEAPIQHQQSSDKAKDDEGLKQDLRSRGLCLMPISSTFQVVETTADFWTPTFGGSYR